MGSSGLTGGAPSQGEHRVPGAEFSSGSAELMVRRASAPRASHAVRIADYTSGASPLTHGRGSLK